ncbi:MAG: DUF5103 domain-containing protein [Salibacteraceae bacterium]
MKYFLFLVTFVPIYCLSQVTNFGEDVEYTPENKNKVYNEFIKTVQLNQLGTPTSAPILYLNTGTRLLLSFDDLKMEINDVNYQIFHCDANWNRSKIDHYQYANGVEEGYVSNYDYSMSMNQRYIHYSLMIPNEEIQITASGNYIIMVYRNNNPKDLLFTRRFFVVENKVGISMDIHRAFDPEFRESKQEVDIVIDYNRFNLTNPGQTVKLALLQNNRWDNAKLDLKPNFIGDQKLTYDYEDVNTFWAGNEYRAINISNFDMRSENIEGIIKRTDTTYFFVEKAKPKFQHSFTDRFNNRYGAQEIAVFGSANTETEPDYALVYFYILADYPDNSGDFYVFGALSNYEHSPEYRMVYNTEKKRYELPLYLKQGLYNWHFHFLPERDDAADVRPMEGSFSETLNNYTVLVYYQGITDDYDRIVGYKTRSFPTLD